MNISSFWLAVILTSFAGLSTGIGSLLAFFTKQTNTKFLSISLGFSAGVMIYISFMELLPESFSILSKTYTLYGSWICILSFFIGFGIIALIDKLVPSYENPHEMHHIEELHPKNEKKQLGKLYHVGILMALAISIHNLPEGLVTFLGTITNSEMGIAIAFAVAIHNIPEGIAVSVPIYYSTGSRKKAFFYSFLSGLAEPIGGILGYLLLKPLINDLTVGIVFALIAGIMVFISFDTLLPSAEEYGNHHLSIIGVVAGMVVMAVSLLLL